MTPMLTSAAVATPKSFGSLVDLFLSIINLLITFIFALTFIVLVWAIIRTWVIGGAEEAQVEKGKKIITTGVLVLVVMVGIWGIIALLRGGIFGI